MKKIKISYNSYLQIYVLQDTDLMRFVFDNDPSTVQKRLSEFSDELGRLYRPQPLKFNIYETEFYSQVDGSLDFGRTRYVKESICSIDSIELILINR